MLKIYKIKCECGFDYIIRSINQNPCFFNSTSGKESLATL